MKRLITFTLLFFAILNLVSQKKCQKITYTEIDEFTNLTTKGTGFVSLVGCFTDPCIFMAAQNIEGVNYLKFSAIASDIFSIKKGDKIFIKASNGRILELIWEEDVTADYRIITTLNDSTEWRVNTRIRVSKDELEWFALNDIEKVRWQSDKYQFEKKTKSKQTKTIKNYISCYLELIE